MGLGASVLALPAQVREPTWDEATPLPTFGGLKKPQQEGSWLKALARAHVLSDVPRPPSVSVMVFRHSHRFKAIIQ